MKNIVLVKQKVMDFSFVASKSSFEKLNRHFLGRKIILDKAWKYRRNYELQRSKICEQIKMIIDIIYNTKETAAIKF